MSCGASAIRYLLWALGMGGSVLLLFIKCHACQKAGSPVGFFFLSSVPWLRLFGLYFFFNRQPFQLLRRVLQWPTHVLHV